MQSRGKSQVQKYSSLKLLYICTPLQTANQKVKQQKSLLRKSIIFSTLYSPINLPVRLKATGGGGLSPPIVYCIRHSVIQDLIGRMDGWIDRLKAQGMRVRLSTIY